MSKVKKLAADWTYDVISIGYPGPVLGGRRLLNLRTWARLGRFDFAFGRPAKVLNDAALQALGSYKGGKMLLGPEQTGSADGARPFAVQEWHIRGIRRTGLERDGRVWRSSSGSRRPCSRMTR